jgi:CheY-like chemotaxis protein
MTRQILVVEDEPLIRMLAVDMLDVLGFGAVEAADGAEAVAIDAETLKGFAALMVDLGLPDLPGEEVVRRLLERRPDLPVIITSGSDAAASAKRLGLQHTVTILEKPYQLKDLEQAVAGLTTVG